MSDERKQYGTSYLDQPANEPELPGELEEIYSFLNKVAGTGEGLTIESLFEAQIIGRAILKRYQKAEREWSVCVNLTQDTESDLHDSTIGEALVDGVISPIVGDIQDVVIGEDNSLALLVDSYGIGQRDSYTVPVAYCGEMPVRRDFPVEMPSLARVPLEKRLNQDELEIIDRFYDGIGNEGVSGADLAKYLCDEMNTLSDADSEAYMVALNLELDDAYVSGFYYSVLLHNTSVRVVYDHQLPDQEPITDWIDDGAQCNVVRLACSKDARGKYANFSVVAASEDNDRLFELELRNEGISFHRAPSDDQ